MIEYGYFDIFQSYVDTYEGYQLNEGVCLYSLSDTDKRVLDEALWLLDNKSSLSQVAKEFSLSKSQIYKDLSSKLNNLSCELHSCVQRQLKKNKLKYFR